MSEKDDVLDEVLRISKEIEEKKASLDSSVDKLKQLLAGGSRPNKKAAVVPAPYDRAKAFKVPIEASLREKIRVLLGTKFKNRGATLKELSVAVRRRIALVEDEILKMRTANLVHMVRYTGRNRWLLLGDQPVRQRPLRSSSSPTSGNAQRRQQKVVSENPELHAMIAEKLLSALETKDDSITGLTRRIGHGFYEVKVVLGALIQSKKAESYTFERKGRKFTYFRLPTVTGSDHAEVEPTSPAQRSLSDVMDIVEELTGDTAVAAEPG